MNSSDLAHLVEHIIATWPTGPRGFIWTEALADLEHPVALGIYEYLRDHDERPPSVSRFLAVYHSTTPDYGWQPPVDSGPSIGLDEYFARVRVRVERGDPDAADELARWTRFLTARNDGRLSAADEAHKAGEHSDEQAAA